MINRDIFNIPINVKIVLEKAIKNYKLRKFRKLVYDNKYIRNLNETTDSFKNKSLFQTDIQFENTKFKILSNELCKKELINSMNFILQVYLDYFPINLKINSREILSAWMIYNYKGILEDYINKEFILQFSKELIDKFKILNKLHYNELFDIVNFNRIFIRYYESFIIFKEKDKIDKLNYFVKEWKNLEDTKYLIEESYKYTSEEKTSIIDIINTDKQKIQKYITQIKKDYDFDSLKRIIYNTQKMKRKIIDNYKNILESELNLKRYDLFIKILDEIKTFLIIFNPTKKEDYEERIDSKLYAELLEYNLIKQNDLNDFGDYLVQQVLQLGSKSLEEEQIKIWMEYKNKISDLNILINQHISFLLIFIMEIIEKIKLEINDYEVLLNIMNNNI